MRNTKALGRLVRLGRVVSLGLVVAALAACAQGPSSVSAFQGETVFSNLAAKPARAAPKQTAKGLVPIDGGVGETIIVSDNSSGAGGGGGGRGGRRADSPDLIGGGGSYTMNFDNAPLADVVRAVLNDALGLSYSSAAELDGRVTISSARPVGRNELLSILENLLASEGFALVQQNGQYRIEPSETAVGAAGSGDPGFGTTVVPLRYVSLDTMNTIVTGFIAPAENLRISNAQNAIIVRGPADRRREAAEAILSFDADWMKGQTAAIFELRRAQPAAVVTELESIFATGEGSGGNGTIEFKAIPRLRAVMAISKSSTLIRRATHTVRELDVANASAEENVFVYRARYRNARELARVVGNLFNASGSGGTGTEAIGEEAPGAEPAAEGEDGGSATAFTQEETSSGEVSGEADAGEQQDRFAAAASLFAGGEGQDGETIDLRTEDARGRAPIRISADAANNAVVVYADGETYEKILATLKALDVTPVQVAINVTIAEVRLTNELEFGVQYFVKSQSVGLGKNNGSASLFTEVANTIQKQIPGFNFVIGSNRNPDVIISALDEITDVEILSSPSLVVLENETATLQVGDSVPVTVRQAQSVDDVNAPLVNQVEFRDTGIILSVTPRIGENDAVTMRVAQEISAVASDAGSLTPTFSRRRVTSSISVQSAQTVLLAGLISSSRDRSNNGIPVLKDVPVAGKLFGTDSKGAGRTELVVLIRPVVIRSGEDASSVANDFRSRLGVINDRAGGGAVLKN